MNRAVIVNPEWAAGNPDAPKFLDAEVSVPSLGPRDLLVRVEAIGLNPIDLRMMRAQTPADQPRVLGWDACGVVTEIGPEVEKFRPGDAVFYAGSLLRPGAMQSLQAVDERLVGLKPRTLNFAQAAALPMASLVSWEGLFGHLGLGVAQAQDADGPEHACQDILIWGGGGGVGSVAIQLAAVAGCRVIASASHSTSADHCREMGADMIVDHTKPLSSQLDALGIRSVPRILCLHDPADLIDVFSKAISPFGMICCLADSEKPVAVNALRKKSAVFAWEGVFTRSLFGTADMFTQADILNRVAAFVDRGTLRAPLKTARSGMDAAQMADHYAWFETRHRIGKMVVTRQ